MTYDCVCMLLVGQAVVLTCRCRSAGQHAVRQPGQADSERFWASAGIQDLPPSMLLKQSFPWQAAAAP